MIGRVFAPIDRLMPAERGLAEARYDVLDLRKRAVTVGASRPWPVALPGTRGMEPSLATQLAPVPVQQHHGVNSSDLCSGARKSRCWTTGTGISRVINQKKGGPHHGASP